jgi:hypothetical protein
MGVCDLGPRHGGSKSVTEVLVHWGIHDGIGLLLQSSLSLVHGVHSSMNG